MVTLLLKRPGFRRLAAVVIFVSGVVSFARADVYFVCPVESLSPAPTDDPAAADEPESSYRYWWRRGEVPSYGTLSGDGEIYVSPSSDSWWARQSTLSNGASSQSTVAIRLPAAQELTGKVYVPNENYSGMKVLELKVGADQWSEAKEADFLRVKLAAYEHLSFSPRPGAAWFRHQARAARKQLGESPEADAERPNRFGTNETMLERTYAMASGGRAISENLQLDRVLPQAAAELPKVELASIAGIKVESFDWKELLKDAKPERDRLAAAIPHDQYAVFAPSFAGFVALADAAGQQGEIFLRAAEPQAENAQVRQRYERQLGLELSEFARKIGPALIKSVAITGADPYLRTGADVALLFEANDGKALGELLKAQIARAVADNTEVEEEAGTIDGTDYQSLRTPDRAVCSYLATLEDVVVVTNSPAQLRQLIAVHKGTLESLGDLDEFAFFRNRYVLGANGESGFLLLSDDTIRKWCGPRWRIATSRRTRAAALMAELQAAHLDGLVKQEVSTGPLHTDLASADMGEFRLGPQGVQSSVYGTLEFLTPVLELEFDKVTQTEVEFYQRWRTGYERNWSTFFDPIAIQFRVKAEELAADLTVMPLIEFSAYRQMVRISKGAKLEPDSGDPHAGSLLHAVLALNLESELLSQQANMATMFTQVNPLKWLGPSVALYLDDDPLWKEFPQQGTEKELQEFFQNNIYRLPVALHFEVSNSFQLIAFLTGMRTYIEQATPGMTRWETLTFKEQPYVKVSPSQTGARRSAWDKISLYYRASGGALTLTLSEDLLKRAIDRQLSRDEPDAAAEPAVQVPRWLGENFALTFDGKVLQVLQAGLGDMYQRQMQRMAWANLPILNEWYKRYPNEDPVALHREYWQRELVCPGGGKYQWNDKWQTMESSVYGHPGDPKVGSGLPRALQYFTSGNFGQTFEEDGLRVRIELGRREEATQPQAGD